jgi:hypothetical protein
VIERYFLWRGEGEWETKRNSLLIDLFVYRGYGHRWGGDRLFDLHITYSEKQKIEGGEWEGEGRKNKLVYQSTSALLAVDGETAYGSNV